MKFGQRFTKKYSSSSTKKMAAAPAAPPKLLTSSLSLGGGTIGHDGLVQLLKEQQDQQQPVIGKGLRYRKRMETAETLARTETNSSLDSASVRDDNELEGFSQLEFDTVVVEYSDDQLRQALEDAVDLEKHVLVARYLTEMEKRNLQLSNNNGGPQRQATLKKNAEQLMEIIDSHGQDAEASGWTKKGLMHGRHRDTMVYHRTNDKGEVTVRCETPIQASLVAPLLAILNETDLYTTWCPSFQRPFKLGVSDTGKHMQCSRASQVAYAKVDMPWPMNNREVIVKNLMAEAVDEMGALVIRAKTMEVGEEVEGFTAPSCEPGWDRIKMDAALLLKKCPEDHPTLKRQAARKNKRKQNSNTSEQQETEEPMLLATFTLYVTPSVNTILKVIAGPMWSALIGFADDVQNGKKGALHRKRMEETPELYGWVNETVERMAHKCA